MGDPLVEKNHAYAVLAVILAIGAFALALATPPSHAQSGSYYYQVVGGKLVPPGGHASANLLVGLIAAASVVIGLLVASKQKAK